MASPSRSGSVASSTLSAFLATAVEPGGGSLGLSILAVFGGLFLLSVGGESLVSGASRLALHFRLTPTEALFICQDCGVSAVIAEAALADIVDAVRDGLQAFEGRGVAALGAHDRLLEVFHRLLDLLENVAWMGGLEK